MNRVETSPPTTKPFPVVSLLVAAGVAFGLVCLIGCLVVLAGVLGTTKHPTVPSSISAVFAAKPAAERDRIVGTWRTEGWIDGQPCSYRFTFGPTTTYAFTIECTLSDGRVVPPGHGSYFCGNGELRWKLEPSPGSEIYSDLSTDGSRLFITTRPRDKTGENAVLAIGSTDSRSPARPDDR